MDFNSRLIILMARVINCYFNGPAINYSSIGKMSKHVSHNNA